MSLIKPKRNLSFYLLACLSLFLYSSNSLAMGKLGHQLVCQLAFENLPQSAQEKLTKQLSAIPRKHKTLINKYLYKKANASISYAHACTWADAIKKDKSFQKFNAWHYLNIPRHTQNITANSCLENCITQAIAFHQTQYVTHTNPWIKTQALLFLGHWYADIHQPLHVSFASDLGGNKSKKRLMSTSKLTHKCNNLHWIWDECLLYLPQHKNVKQVWDEHYQSLQVLWKRTTKEQYKAWQKSQPWEMANESYLLAKAPNMQYCQNKDNRCVMLNNNSGKLPKNYQEEHYPILQKRLLQAAFRLNKVLSDLLKPP